MLLFNSPFSIFGFRFLIFHFYLLCGLFSVSSVPLWFVCSCPGRALGGSADEVQLKTENGKPKSRSRAETECFFSIHRSQFSVFGSSFFISISSVVFSLCPRCLCGSFALVLAERWGFGG